ncbi:MAG: SH3 domain-containing protein [Peptococcaceae bacterium]|nr:SH3 domain-containing protein [Peptococcaceae bacterium]
MKVGNNQRKKQKKNQKRPVFLYKYTCKYACAMLLAAGLVFVGGQAYGATQVTVNTDVLNVRSDAGTSFSKVGSVALGDVFTALQEKNGWYQIVLTDGKVGWVSKDYVQTATNLYPEQVTVDSGLVNIRSGPDTTYDKIGELTPGIRLQVLGKTKDWYSVYLPDGKTVGWVASWVVKSAGTSTVTPEQPGNSNNPGGSGEDPVVFSGPQGKVNTASLNVRKSASDSAAKITSLPSGTIVNILSEKGTILDANNCWYEISTGSTTGWVRSSYVDIVGADRSSYGPKQADALQWNGNGEAPGSGNIQGKSVTYGIQLQITASGPVHYRMEDISNGMVIYTDAKLQGDLSNAQHNDITVAYHNEEHSALKITWKSRQNVALLPSEEGKSLEIRIGSSSLIGKFIVLDPGHGTYTSASGSGIDSGAVGTGGLHEQIVTLEIGKKTRDYLEGRGATVVMTRTGGSYLTLNERAWLANALDSDVFVSIHCNSATNKTAKGTGTYFYAPVGNTRYDRGERQRLAQCIQNAVLASAGRSNYGVKEDNFAVIRETDMSSVLIETAFISNLEEEMLLASDDFRDKMAYGIANGIENYFAK